jgi:ArsR family transcriptional regulator
MRDFMNITKALADENRIRVLMLLRDGELCLCEIITMLGLASSTVSKHMSILYQAGLVRARKEGRWRYFRLPGKDAPRPVAKCLRWISESLEEEKTIVRDSRKLKSAAITSLKDLCK